MIAITTSVFSTPIVIRGPGAGGPETSFGVISDVIKILKANNLVSVSPLGIINA